MGYLFGMVLSFTIPVWLYLIALSDCHTVTISKNPLSVKDGDNITLTCEYSGSSSEDSIGWFNTSDIYSVTYESSCQLFRPPNPAYYDITRITASCNSVTNIYTLTIRVDKLYDQSTNWMCAFSFNDGTNGKSRTSAVINVEVPLTYVTISGTSSVIQDTVTNFTCITSVSWPQANVTWFIGIMPMPETRRDIIPKEKGLTYVISTLALNPQNQYHGNILYCRASNGIIVVTASNITLYVQVNVTSVILDSPDSSIIFLKNFSRSVTCKTSPSRPEPVIKWQLDGIMVYDLSNWIRMPDDTYVAKSEVHLVQNRTYQNKTLICSASVKDQVIEASSEPKRIVVWYPPSMPKNFFFVKTENDNLVFGLEKGFSGGLEQTFVIQYLATDKTDAGWTTVLWIKEGYLISPFMNGTYYIWVPLQLVPSDRYTLRVFAQNEIGNSSALTGLVVIVKADVLRIKSSLEVGLAIGIAAGAFLLGMMTCKAVLLIRRQLCGTRNACVRKHESPQEIHTYSNTEMSSTSARPIYEDLDKDSTERSMYDKLSGK